MPEEAVREGASEDLICDVSSQSRKSKHILTLRGNLQLLDAIRPVRRKDYSHGSRSARFGAVKADGNKGRSLSIASQPGSRFLCVQRMPNMI